MNIIVSGASGYIGSKLCVLLKQQGHILTALSRTENEIIKKLNIHYKIVDITQSFTDLTIPNIDVFIHLAAANDVDSQNHFSALNINAFGTKNCLDFCVKNNISKFIYFSTFQIYGALNKNINDDTEPSPNNDYGLTHLFAEEYVKMYHRNNNIDFLIIRPTNIYGVPYVKEIDRWSLVPGCFCKEAIEKGIITLNSSGLQKRDFVNLDDLTAFTSFCLKKFGQVKNKTINFSSGNQFAIIEIAKRVIECVKIKFFKEVVLKIKSENPREPDSFLIDRSSLLKNDFVFSKNSTILDEISLTLDLLV